MNSAVDLQLVEFACEGARAKLISFAQAVRIMLARADLVAQDAPDGLTPGQVRLWCVGVLGNERELTIAEREPIWAEIDQLVRTPAGAKADRILDAAEDGEPMPAVLSCEVREACERLNWLYDRA